MSVARQHIAALDAESLHAIEKGAHAAPFSVLGVQNAAGRRMLRVHAPGAWRVEARARRDRSLIAVLDQSLTPGLFAAPFDGEAAYLLRIYWPGRIDEHEDPYSFSPAIPAAQLRALLTTRMRGAGGLLGAHAAVHEGVPGARFAIWAPAAASVAVAGDFNQWSDRRHLMERRGESGVWELFIPRIGVGARYYFAIRDHEAGGAAPTVDPFAREIETEPRLAAVVAEPLRHDWRDERFLAIRRARRDCAPPAAIYRIEPDAWLTHEGRPADWRGLGERLPPFVSALGFTHVQIGRGGDGAPCRASWMFAPPPGLGRPQEFAAFVDACHEAGLAVFVEWDAPEIFAPETFAPDLADSLFVENVLADSALHWLETFHVDGLSLKAPRGAPHIIDRLRAEIERNAPGAALIVEDPNDRAPPDASAHAVFWKPDAVIAALKGQAQALRCETAASLEGALLPMTPQTLAHFAPAEETGDALALLRATYAFAWLTPGMKLMHMGAELGQHAWPNRLVAWEALDDPRSLGFLKLVRDLNNTLRNEAPIALTTRVSQSMTWLAAEAPVVAYIRSGEAAAPLLVAMNRGETRRVRLESPNDGHWRELINTDSRHYGGGDVGNFGGAHAIEHSGRPGTFLLDITLPTRGTIIFRNES